MKALKCASCGMFYDEDKYETCPHCKSRKAAQSVGTEDSKESPEEKPQKKSGRKFKNIFSKKNKITTEIKADAKIEKTEPEKNDANYEYQTLSEAILNANSTERLTQSKTQGYYKFSGGIEPAVGWLTCVKGEYMGETFTVKAGRNSIGRSLSNSIALAKENSICRERHAQITFEPHKRQFFIQNGEGDGMTYVNDELVVTFCELKNYDVIAMGDIEFVFVALCGEKFSWEDYKDR